MSRAAEAVRVVISDDQQDVRDALRLLLKTNGFEIRTAESPESLLQLLDKERFDIALVDMNYARDTTSGAEGIHLVSQIRRRDPGLPVVAMTAWGSIGLAVEAMRQGASDFLEKPWRNQDVLDLLQKHGTSRQSAKYSDLDAARRVQERLFSRPGTVVCGLEVQSYCCMAHQIGGDAYDCMELGNGRVAFLLADVAGKGASAALMSAHLLGLFRMSLQGELSSLTGKLEEVNRAFYAGSQPSQFATLFFGLYDRRTSELRYVNCGHPPALLLRSSGELELLAPTTTIFGAFPVLRCVEQSVHWAAGDSLLLYSDGVTEALSSGGHEFGEAQLYNIVKAAADFPLESLVRHTADAVQRFCAGPSQDDLTLLGLRRVNQ
jgi:serine phosphatase RsbU (regulator of sigma subunit)